MKISVCLAAAGAAWCLARPSNAAITFFDIFYTASYTQTTASPPTAPDLYYFATRVISNNPGDLTGAKLSVPPASVIYTLFPVGPGSYLAVRNFATQTAMETTFPAGAYDFSINGGTLGSAAASIQRPASLFFCSEIPAFDAPSMDLFAAYPSNQDVNVGFDGFATPAGANTGAVFLTVFDSSNAVVFNISQNNPVAALTIPAGTLQPGASYRATLYYTSRIQLPNGGFGTADSIVGCDRSTSAAISTRPACLGDLNGDTFVDDNDFVIFAVAYNILDCADPGMPAGCPADLTLDGLVDDTDFVLFAAAYNDLVCP